MKVIELVEKYKNNQRIDIAKEIETKKYVGIALKRHMAQLVLDNCTTIVDGEVHIDSVEKYILFITAVISIHTNLEFSDEENELYSALDDYDLLCESGLLAKIIDTFKDDYASCQEILNMMTADKMQDSVTLEKKIGNFLDDIQGVLSNVINNFADQLSVSDLLNILPSDNASMLELYDLIKEK